MDFKEFVRPELLVLIPILYLLGMWIKASACKNWLIPFILCGVGIVLSALWILGWQTAEVGKNVFAYIFSAITQGILVAGVAVLANNVKYQATVGRVEDNSRPDREV
jgi:hypothetical protein